MRELHADKPEIVWKIADATTLSTVFGDEKFDVVFDKGVADTILFRSSARRGSQMTLNKMYSEIYRTLTRGGSYVVISPRSRLPHLQHRIKPSASSMVGRGVHHVPKFDCIVKSGPLPVDFGDTSSAVVKRARPVYFFRCDKGAQASDGPLAPET